MAQATAERALAERVKATWDELETAVCWGHWTAAVPLADELARGLREYLAQHGDPIDSRK